MFLLLAGGELMGVVERDAAPDEVTVHNLHTVYLHIYLSTYLYISMLIKPTSVSASVNMLPLVLTSSMIASTSSSWEQIGWQRTLPARSCGHNIAQHTTLAQHDTTCHTIAYKIVWHEFDHPINRPTGKFFTFFGKPIKLVSRLKNIFASLC